MGDKGARGYSGAAVLDVMDEAVNYNAFLLSLITSRAQASDRLVDFGAGTGMLARPLAAAGYDISCIEPDDELCGSLRAAGLDAHIAIEAVSPRSVDIIYAVNVLEHIPDDLAILAALHERLKPDGRLLVYVPAFPILYTSFDCKIGHVRRYRRAGLADLLGRAGFTVEHIAYQDSLGFFAALLFRLTDSGTGTINRRAVIAYDRCVFPISRRLDRFCGNWFGKNSFVSARR